MYQEEILKAIKEQTKAIEHQNELLDRLVCSVETLNSSFNINTIATAVVRKLKAAEEMKLDAEFFAGNLDEYDRQTDAEFREESRKKRLERKVK